MKSLIYVLVMLLLASVCFADDSYYQRKNYERLNRISRYPESTSSYYDVKIKRNRVEAYEYDTGRIHEMKIKMPFKTRPIQSPWSFTHESYNEE